MTRLLAPLFLLLTLSACTTIGIEDSAYRDSLDYGPRAELRLCILRDESLSMERVVSLLEVIRTDMEPFDIHVTVPWIRPWERPGFDYVSILRGVIKAGPLEEPCDRMMAFVGRDVSDFIYGLTTLPEVLGAVETGSHTRGFAVAEFASLNQVFSSPGKTAAHEFFHLLGCNHSLTMNDCYRSIQRIKAEQRRLKAGGSEFFPGVSPRGRFIPSRRLADQVMTTVWDRADWRKK